MVLIPLSIRKCYIPLLVQCHPSHLTSCTPTKSNLYFAILLTLLWVNVSLHSTYQISCPFSLASVANPKNRTKSKVLCDILHQTTPYSKQSQPSYLPYLRAISSIGNPRICHAITRDPLGISILEREQNECYTYCLMQHRHNCKHCTAQIYE
jgi:hypothetical protein